MSVVQQQAASAATSDAPKWEVKNNYNPQAVLYSALAAAQGEMGAASKDGTNPHFKSRYATLASVCEAVRAPFAKHGLCHYAQPSVEGQTVSVCIVIGHEAGGEISAILSAQARDASPQSIGSAITYLRRYGLMALAGVPAEDDDAESATNHGGNVTPFRRQQDKPLPTPEDQARVLADTAKIKKATTMVELDALAEGFKSTYAENPGGEEVRAAWAKRKAEISNNQKGA